MMDVQIIKLSEIAANPKHSLNPKDYMDCSLEAIGQANTRLLAAVQQVSYAKNLLIKVGPERKGSVKAEAALPKLAEIERLLAEVRQTLG